MVWLTRKLYVQRNKALKFKLKNKSIFGMAIMYIMQS